MRATMIILLLCAFGAVDAKRRGGRGKKVSNNVINKNNEYIEGSKTAVPGGEFKRYKLDTDNETPCSENSFFGDFTFLWEISEEKCTVSGSVTGPTGSGQPYMDFKVDGVITEGTPSDPEYPAPDTLNATQNNITCAFNVPGLEKDFTVEVQALNQTDPTSLGSEGPTTVFLNTCQLSRVGLTFGHNSLTAPFKNPSYTVASGLTLTQQSGGGFQVEGLAVFDPKGQKPVVTNYKYTVGTPSECPWTPEACDSYPVVPEGTQTPMFYFYGEADTFNDKTEIVDEYDYIFVMWQTDKETDRWIVFFPFYQFPFYQYQVYYFVRTPGSIGNESPVVLNDRKVNNWNGSSEETKFNKNKLRQNKKNKKAKKAARKAAKRAKQQSSVH